jgi:DNA-binding CsgD family transcriptional regulator
MALRPVMNMTRGETIHQAIRQIYEAALTPDGWSRAALAVTQALASHKAILLSAPATRASFAITAGFDAESAERMQREFEMRPPQWVKSIPPGMPLRQTSFVSDSAFRRSEFYHRAVRPAGGFYGMIAPVAPDRHIYFATGRELGAANFSDEDLSAAQLIFPHLMTALQVRSRLAAADLRAQGACEVVSRLDFGVVLLDAAMRPIFANPRAEALARCRDGLVLTRDAVAAAQPTDARRLRDAIASALGLNQGGSEALVRRPAQMTCHLPRRPPRAPLVVRAVPVAASDLPAGDAAATRAILFVMEPDRPMQIDPRALPAACGLTRREAALAALLARGMDLTEAASEMGIGLGTARGYLKQSLAKTSTHRQAELVSLLLRTNLPVVT